ncbi:MAG: hypothetical protein JJE25_08980 [Bacteroidia bacterium]|nr:hypothetical protein [Bacteroidia bacterium]
MIVAGTEGKYTFEAKEIIGFKIGVDIFETISYDTNYYQEPFIFAKVVIKGTLTLYEIKNTVPDNFNYGSITETDLVLKKSNGDLNRVKTKKSKKDLADYFSDVNCCNKKSTMRNLEKKKLTKLSSFTIQTMPNKVFTTDG